jgi:CubicO group peptidase (beta-lactamase class C family)
VGANRLLEVIEQQLGAGLVGLAIAVVAGGEVRWSGGFGRLDVDRPDPVTTQTVFPVQSVSKSIVATALMHWVERGDIGLDDPVNRHLGAVQVANEWEHTSPITIRQLLTHTAGLPMSLGWGSSPSLEALVRDEVRTEAEPGTRLIYANWGYDVAGYLVSRLAGTPWDAAVRAAVLDPLAMTATHAATATSAETEGAPTGHAVSQFDGTHLRLGPPEWPFAPGPPSGALVSNVEDLARFLIAHLTGSGGALAPETFAAMHRLHAPLGAGGGGMGLGFRVDQRGGRPFFCHVGDGGGFTTFVGGHPDEQVGVALLLNVGGAETARAALVRAALESVLDDPSPRAVAPRAAIRPPVGRYRSTYWGLGAEVVETDGVPTVAMASSSLGEAANTGRLSEVGGRWRAEGGMFDGCELDFDVTADGRRFCGGLYPFEFLADESPVVALPDAVDETGDLSGVWGGTIDTPVGPVPIRIEVETTGVTAALMDVAGADPRAVAADGWIRARFAFEIAGFGAIEMIMRLGLTSAGLEGLVYARHPTGELAMPVVLAREGGAPPGP